MATSYPASVDTNSTLPNPGSDSYTNSPDHASLHGNANDAIKAVQSKVGIGANIPAADTILRGTAPGESSWGPLTSVQFAAIMTDEVGSASGGKLVFSNSPVLITPKIDTISESTPDNGVNIDSLVIKDGKLSSDDSVDSNAYVNGSIDGEHLAANANYLGQQGIAGSFTDTTVGAYVDVTNMAVIAVVPTGNTRLVRVTVDLAGFYTSAATGSLLTLAIREGATVLRQIVLDPSVAGNVEPRTFSILTGATVGSHTYKVSIAQNAAGTMVVRAGDNSTLTTPGSSFIWAELA